MILPSSDAKLLAVTRDLIETCRASAATRSSFYQNVLRWIEQGRGDQAKSLCNTLYHHCDRLSSHLFSPTELRFVVDCETPFDKQSIAMGEVASRVLTRMWEQRNIDLVFAQAVNQSVQLGAGIMKQMWRGKQLSATLVAPWQFGVYREDQNGLNDQEVLCETSLITIHEANRRIRGAGIPEGEAKDMMARIIAQASSGPPGDIAGPSSFFHQILSTSVLNTTDTQGPPRPGGIVDLSSPAFILGPEVNVPMVVYHELYVIDEVMDDYCTIQLIEPDILLEPRARRRNICAPKTHPYTLIQPNTTSGYFWGRSEIMDLMEPQGLLSDLLNDIRRIMGMQFDKLLAFPGEDGMTDERYAQFRTSGFVTLSPGASVTDLTPKLPDASFQYVTLLSKMMEQISGFDNILSGQGEAGVRAGVHADTLIRTASPRLRDRSLLVERQCAEAADKSLELLEAYDNTPYRSNDPQAEVELFLGLLPDSRKVSVDSHSSSPIYEQDHKELIAFGVKSGFIDGESAIDMLPFPMKDKLKIRLREKQAAQQKLIQEHPEMLTHGKGLGGHK